MASSPPAPFPANLPNPKKRPSMSLQASQTAANKRPKLHPLRQTSFPANGDPNAYGSAVASAPSESGSVANSTFSSVSATKAQPRGRGRPRKSLQVADDDVRVARDGGSTAGNRNFQAKSVISAARSGVGANADDEPEEEEEEEVDEHDIEENIDEQKADEAKTALFVDQLSAQQSTKYNLYRSSKLKDSVVKRIVNQTVSQSVGQNAIHAVQYFSKAFAIEIIERAREVQLEWAKALESSIQRERQVRLKKLHDAEKDFADKQRASREHDPPAALSEQETRAFQTEIKRLKDSADRYVPNKHRGGLLPDHLREALRRYKTDGDGNGFGFDGLSHPLLGVQGANSWRVGDGAAGQRLFR